MALHCPLADLSKILKSKSSLIRFYFIYCIVLQSFCFIRNPEPHLELSRISTTKVFCENSEGLSAINYFRKKARSQISNRFVNTPLTSAKYLLDLNNISSSSVLLHSSRSNLIISLRRSINLFNPFHATSLFKLYPLEIFEYFLWCF